MEAIVIDEPGCWGLREVPQPEIHPQNVCIRVEACGLCGTDLHTLGGETPTARYPLIPGHEFGGVVTEVGEGGGGDLEIGQRVGVFPSAECRQCRYCWDGLPNLCNRRGGYGTAHPGGLAEYVTVPASNCLAIPQNIPARDAALIEPLACVLHGLERLGPAVHGRTMILGAGTIGLLTLELLRLMGGRDVAVLERHESRLGRVEDRGARPVHPDELDARTNFDVVVDATGSPVAIEKGLDKLAKGGRFLMLGVTGPVEQVSIRPFDIYSKELVILGSMAMQHTYRKACELVVTGAINVSNLITHEFTLRQFDEAIGTIRSGEGLKVVVLPSVTDSTAKDSL